MKTKYGEATALDVPFDEKENAKKHGARWAADFRVWVWPHDKGPLPDELKEYWPQPSPWSQSKAHTADTLTWELAHADKEYQLVLVRDGVDLWIFSRVGQLSINERQPLLVRPLRQSAALARATLTQEQYEEQLADAKKRDSVDTDLHGRPSNTGTYTKKVEADRQSELDSVAKLIAERNEIQNECLKLVT